ncbi:glycine cleavage system protein GcvH [Halobacterium zhouii]|uniref:glycine cleavage system protein GcvH n=1 Tax=Halobacterium zhouii TaxID=2902624 RepID=UPI001E62A8D9|nr:glycine cleavage system protein GcvH [Halobacterium zhouii]
MSFDVPQDLYYLESHEWIDPDTGRVGISEFAQDELGDIVFVELPSEGDHLDADDTFGVVESIKAVSDVYAPVSGDVTAVNDALGDQPELVNDDPFGEGWLLELDFDEDELDELLTAEEYEEQIA